MKFALSSAVSALLLLIAIDALSLSYRMKSFENRACFYVPVTDTSALIQLYYSVNNAKSFDDTKASVNMVVQGPKGQQLHSIQSQSHTEISLKPIEIGDHSICFTHSSSPTDKTIDIDVTMTNQDGTPFLGQKAQVTSSPDKAAQELENTVSRLNKDLSEINHTMKYLKNREKRNMETIDNIDKVIWYYSILETALIFGMSLCQIGILRHFFGRSGRPRV